MAEATHVSTYPACHAHKQQQKSGGGQGIVPVEESGSEEGTEETLPIGATGTRVSEVSGILYPTEAKRSRSDSSSSSGAELIGASPVSITSAPLHQQGLVKGAEQFPAEEQQGQQLGQEQQPSLGAHQEEEQDLEGEEEQVVVIDEDISMVFRPKKVRVIDISGTDD